MSETSPGDRESWIHEAATRKVDAARAGAMRLSESELAQLYEHYVNEISMSKVAGTRQPAARPVKKSQPVAPKPAEPKPLVVEYEPIVMPPVEELPPMVMDPDDPRYQVEGACYEADEQVFVDPTLRSVASAYCAGCILRKECLLYQLKHNTTTNYRAGFTNDERNLIREQLAPGALEA